MTVTVTRQSETSETVTDTGRDVPSFLAALTVEVMLHGLLLNFAITNPRMVTTTRPLLAATIPTTGVELSVSGRSTTGQRRLPQTTEGLHSTTVVHLLHLLLVMTVVSLWMIAR